MKIALINPPLVPVSSPAQPTDYYCFPMGLGYLAAYARQAGHVVKIFDPGPCKMPLAKMWKKVEAFRPDLVGISSLSPNFMLACGMVEEAKRRLDCLVVMGGAHATSLPRSTLQRLPALDAVIMGEGEISLLALAAEFDARGKVDLGRIPGAAFMKNGRYLETPRPEMIQDLDRLPYPARDLVDFSLYLKHPLRASYAGWPRHNMAARNGADSAPLRARPERKSAAIITSRGCPSQCIFCANICMGRKFRPHSPEYVVGEMEHLVKKYGVSHFQIVDDCFTASPRRASAICDLIIKKRMRVTWDACVRVNTLLDEAMLRKMKKAGCVFLMQGIETGDQHINDLMKKGTTLEMAERSCALLRRHGIAYINSFIVGHEGDTEETILASIAFAKRLRSGIVHFGLMVPYPGTPLFDKYYKDYDRPDTDWTQWCLMGRGRQYEPRQTALSNEELFELMALNSRYCRTTAYWRLFRDFAKVIP